MLVPRAVATSPNLPRSCVSLGITEFRSPSDERGAHPACLPLVFVVTGLLDAFNILARPNSEDEQVVRLDESLEVPHQAPGVFGGPFLCEGNLQFLWSRDQLGNRCSGALWELVFLHVLPDTVDSWKVRLRLVGMDWSSNQLVGVSKAFAHSFYLRES